MAAAALLLVAAVSSATGSSSPSYDYDLFVIGGGSGGLACAKEAARLGARVGLCDFVRPSSHGTTWGLGGTCVNVGCIPKKLMHHAAQLRQVLEDDAPAYGYALDALPGFDDDGVEHDWSALVGAVQGHVKSLNFGYRSALTEAGVRYFNARGALAGGHEVTLEAANGRRQSVHARHIVLAVGGRPRVPPSLADAADGGGGGGRVITSDDLFSLDAPPGKTLVVGGGYVALECAGFLASLGYDVTLLVRSVPLRGFDAECAELVLASVEAEGAAVVRGVVPVSAQPTGDGRTSVRWQRTQGGGGGGGGGGAFDTVLVATGRAPECATLALEAAGLSVDAEGKLPTCDETSAVEHIHAVGDMASEAPHGRPELTPVAIRTGVLLARRLCGDADVARAAQAPRARASLEPSAIPTAVFAPAEYACVGWSEEEARARLGEERLEVYRSTSVRLEHAPVAGRAEQGTLVKLLCDRDDDERVVGIHVVGEGAAEILPGYALAMRLGATKADLDATIGVHPTVGEELTTLRITRRSGEDASKRGC